MKMYAHKDHTINTGQEFFRDIQPTPKQVKMYGSGDIFEVNVELHKDQTPETKNTGFGIDYWGWQRTIEKDLIMIWPSFPQFSMCFCYGYKSEEERGRGKAYRLSVEEVKK